jgi:hypothetical protein
MLRFIVTIRAPHGDSVSPRFTGANAYGSMRSALQGVMAQVRADLRAHEGRADWTVIVAAPDGSTAVATVGADRWRT